MKLIVVTMVILNLSCTSSFTEAEKKIVAKEAGQMLDDYYADINKDGLTAEFKYLDSSKEFFWVPPGFQQAISYDSVVSIITRNASSFRSVENTWDTLTIIPLTAELASYTGRLRSSMTDTLGKKSEYTLVETGMLIKRKRGWKLLNGQTTILNQ
jgi:hypothetical protein